MNDLSLMNYMTIVPHSIGADQTLDAAQRMMKEHQIRHLPVLLNGQISGILSDRDLKLALSIRGVKADQTTVEEVCTSDVFLVKPHAKLADVVKTMATKKIGCVLVIDNHRLVGIFTVTDALEALFNLIQTEIVN